MSKQIYKFSKADMLKFRNDTTIGGTPFYRKYASTHTTHEMIERWFIEHEEKQTKKKLRQIQQRKQRVTKPKRNNKF